MCTNLPPQSPISMSGGGGGTAAGTGKTTSPQNYRSDRLGLTCSSAVAETAEPAKPTGSRMGKRSYLFSAADAYPLLKPSAAAVAQSPFLKMAWCLLLLLISLNGGGAKAAPTTPSEQIRIPIGKLFTLSPPAGSLRVEPERFPRWCHLNQSGGGEIYGIPQATDVGTHLVAVGVKRRIDVEVVNVEQEWPCHGEQSSIWVEVIDRQRLADMPPSEQYTSLKSMQGILTSGGVTSVQIGDWRLFPFHWLNRYRTVTKSITEPAQALIPSNQAVFVLHLSCGEISETASDIINALAEAGQNFQVVEGHLSTKPLQQSSIPGSRDTAASDESGSLPPRTLALIITAILILVLLLALVFYLVQRWQAGRKLMMKKNGGGKKSGNADESEAILPAHSPASGTTGTDV